MSAEPRTDPLIRAQRRRELIAAADVGGSRIRDVDLSRVVSSGAAGLSVLVDVRARAERHGIELWAIVRSRPVRRPLQVTGSPADFAISRSRADALTEPPGAEAARR